jgi:hypothetical protein
MTNGVSFAASPKHNKWGFGMLDANVQTPEYWQETLNGADRYSADGIKR